MTMMPMDPVFSQKFQMPQPKAGGGMFGGGPSWTNAIQAAIGGYLAGRGMPGGQELLGQVRQRQLMSQQIAMMQQQRQADLEDYRAKKGIDAEFPVNNDTVNDYNFRAQMLGPDAANEWLRNQGDPIVTVQLPGNRVYSGPRSQLGAALGSPAPSLQAGHEEDGYRFKGGNPADPNAWEPVNGGPTARPSGMFP